MKIRILLSWKAVNRLSSERITHLRSNKGISKMLASRSNLFPAKLREIKLITLAKVAEASSLFGGLANNWSRDVISTKSTRMPAKMILNQIKLHAKNYTIATARLPQSLKSWLREYASRGRMCPFVWKEAGYSDWSCTDSSRMRFPLNVRLRN